MGQVNLVGPIEIIDETKVQTDCMVGRLYRCFNLFDWKTMASNYSGYSGFAARVVVDFEAEFWAAKR